MKQQNSYMKPNKTCFQPSHIVTQVIHKVHQHVNYRTEETPSESENVNNNHAYEYDANGNLVYVNTSRTKKNGVADEKTTERKLKWDEENRLLASDDNGFVTNYWYDADGERTVKTSGESDQVYVNSEFAGGRTNTAKFSLYVSPYLVANQGGRYTKHIYIGSQRVVTNLGNDTQTTYIDMLCIATFILQSHLFSGQDAGEVE